MSDRLRGTGAFITGGASGIGAACAQRFAAEGAAVVLGDLESSDEAATQVVQRIRSAGGTAHTIECDVTSATATVDAFEAAADLVGDLSCVVASAGIATHPNYGFDAGLLNIAPEHWNKVLEVNLTGTLHTAQAGGAHMIQRGIDGSIITLASFAAKRPTRGVYSVSKAAVWMLTRALAEELGPLGVRVNSIAPGVIDTPMTVAASSGRDVEAWKEAQAARTTLGRVGQPEDVAAVALFLASADSAYLNGSILHPDGGLASSFAGG